APDQPEHEGHHPVQDRDPDRGAQRHADHDRGGRPPLAPAPPTLTSPMMANMNPYRIPIRSPMAAPVTPMILARDSTPTCVILCTGAPPAAHANRDGPRRPVLYYRACPATPRSAPSGSRSPACARARAADRR